MTAAALSPILLADSFASISDSEVKYADPVRFTNPNKTAMLVDQIRLSGTFDARQYLFSLAMGNIEFTKGFVPVMGAFPRYDVYTSTWIWHLPKPLYVPKNMGLLFGTRRWVGNAGSAATAQSMLVGVAGRSLPADYPEPQNIFVPWSSGFRVDSSATVLSYMDESSLGNPFDKPMRLKRLLGVKTTGSSAQQKLGAGLTVQMTLNSGKMLIRDPALFSTIFPYPQQFMDIDAVLAPKEMIRVQLDLVSSTIATKLSPTTIGMVGYRVVPTPTGVGRVQVGRQYPIPNPTQRIYR